MLTTSSTYQTMAKPERRIVSGVTRAQGHVDLRGLDVPTSSILNISLLDTWLYLMYASTPAATTGNLPVLIRIVPLKMIGKWLLHCHSQPCAFFSCNTSPCIPPGRSKSKQKHVHYTLFIPYSSHCRRCLVLRMWQRGPLQVSFYGKKCDIAFARDRSRISTIHSAHLS